MRGHKAILLTAGLLCVCLIGSGSGTGALANQKQTGEIIVSRGAPTGQAPESRVIQGTVVDPNGRPVPNAAISLRGVGYPTLDATADAGGRFKLQFPPKATAAPQVDVPHIIVRDRQRNLAAAIDMDTIATDPLTIKLASGMILSGKVTDEQRKGIPGTVLSLTFVSDRMWHRLKEEAAKCDPNGRYEIRAVPSDHSYTVDARAEGYGFDHTDPVVADPANNRIELNPIVLRVANLDVSGVVVDGNDRPIPKASVFSSGRGQAPTNVTTDAQGRFTIHGVCAGAIEIRAGSADRGPQYYGPVQATGGATDVKVVIGGPRRN